MSRTVLATGVLAVACAVIGVMLAVSSPAVSKDERQTTGNPQGLTIHNLGI